MKTKHIAALANLIDNADAAAMLPAAQWDAIMSRAREALTEARRDRKTITALKKRINELEDRVSGLSRS